MILFRNFRQEITRLIHPKSISSVHLNGKPVSRAVLHSVSTYFFCYVMIASLSVVLLSFDNFDFKTSFSEMVSCFNNGGVTTAVMSTVGDYVDYSHLSKVVMCFDMLAGRLEIFPMLVLFSPAMWKIQKK